MRDGVILAEALIRSQWLGGSCSGSHHNYQACKENRISERTF
ncbi:hypothetical protein NB689_000124 [Xanthomonas sacchari]|nr:hypothetical protein [Xanthomonas sacchari]MCW0402988.1 hypothetical protein [Xanthomonas sacchari]MCW0414370.1 hypothetical protein [Xanthomonas sacchari]